MKNHDRNRDDVKYGKQNIRQRAVPLFVRDGTVTGLIVDDFRMTNRI